MATDPVTDADNEMTEQARWGLSRADRAVVKLLAGVRAVFVRVKALEDRVTALEQRLPK